MSNKVAVPPTKDALLKSYRKRLKDDIGSMVANFTEIIKLCQISKSEEESQVSRSTLSEEEAFEMQVRAANMVRSTHMFMTKISCFIPLHALDLLVFITCYEIVLILGTCRGVIDEANQ